jgi:hypothetical protein
VVRPLRFAAAIGLATLGMLGAAGYVDAHPLHSTITELVVDPARGTVRVTVRVFVDDLRAAVTRAARSQPLPTGGQAWDAAILPYMSGTFAIRDASGRAVRLHPCGTRRTGDLMWLCLEGDVGPDAEGLQVRNSILCELYEDQVNVVQGVVGRARRSLLFVRGDSFKPIR